MKRQLTLLRIAGCLLISLMAVPVSAQTDNANSGPAAASSVHTHSGPASGMKFDRTGMVMNHNTSELPRDCTGIGAEHSFEVRVGTQYANYPGTVYGMSLHELTVEPCSRVTVTLINDDQVRHQWMLHGLPTYLYPQGMFHLEAAGGQSQTGTFIVPSGNQTYLVHCDMTQHMEKGMKGQLVVGSGSGDLWSVPGISANFLHKRSITPLGVALVLSMAVMSFLVVVFIGNAERKVD